MHLKCWANFLETKIVVDIRLSAKKIRVSGGLFFLENFDTISVESGSALNVRVYSISLFGNLMSYILS